MQSLKDTFYLMLRDRVAAGNAARVVTVRGRFAAGRGGGGERVARGERVAGIAIVDAFLLRWTGLDVDTQGSLPLTGMTVRRLRYATDGTSGNGGMDRGRALTAMDEELSAALAIEPRSVAKVMAVAGQAAASAADGTNVFWGDVTFGPAVIQNERLGRTATLSVFGYEVFGYGE